jgi:transposase
MATRPHGLPARAYYALASLIPSILGSTASSVRVSLAYIFALVAAASRLFPPDYLDAEDAAQELRHLVRRTPRACGIDQTRWTLDAIGRACDWLNNRSPSVIHRLMRRLGIVWKRARASVYSPDPLYEAKLAAVEQAVESARAAPGRIVLLYLDEVTIERQPTVANDYECRGRQQPRAYRSHKADTLTRVVASLERQSGRVVFRRASKITVATLVQFYQDLRAAYPDAERIYVVQDNWPVHTHPDLLVALEPQECRFAWHRPRNWPSAPSAAAIKRYSQLQLPIEIVPLPTYASWANPIEKLWRKLRQDLTHLHEWADDLERLRAEIDRFLRQFSDGSPALLRYVGLGLPD